MSAAVSPYLLPSSNAGPTTANASTASAKNGSARSRDWTNREQERLLRMHAAGYTARQIGEALGRSRNSILGRLFRLGMCKPVGQHGNPAVDRADARAVIAKQMRADGEKILVIAAKLGVQRQTVFRLLRRAA